MAISSSTDSPPPQPWSSSKTLSRSDASSDESVDDVEKPAPEVTATKMKEDNRIILVKHSRIMQKILGSKVKPIPDEPQESPRDRASWFSLISWQWVQPLLKVGYVRLLEINDIWKVSPRDSNERRYGEYRYRLESYLKKPEHKRPSYPEFRAMVYALRWIFLAALINSAVYMGGEIGMSLISRSLITAVDDVYEGRSHGKGPAVGYAIGNAVIQLIFQWVFVWNSYRTRLFAELCRTMLITAVFDKIVRLSPAGRQQYPGSKVTSLITTDTNRVFMAARWTSNLLMFIPGFGGMLGVLIHNLGVSALPGCGLVLLGIVLNVFVSRLITGLRRKSLPFADKRIATMRETVENMRIIKFYGWEKSFVELVSKARSKEAFYLKFLGLVEGMTDASLTSIPTFGGVLAFAVRIILGNGLSPDRAFPSLTIFQVFVPLSMIFSTGLTSHADAWASVKRLNEFFRAPEEPLYLLNDVERGKIIIENGSFKWDAPPPPSPSLARRQRRRAKLFFGSKRVEEEAESPVVMRPVSSAINDYMDEEERKEELEQEAQLRDGAKKFPGLHDINIDIKKGELIMVVGAIGSGKTTLLSSITGTVSKLTGDVHVGGQIATVMSTWNQNASVRDNILFHTPYDAERYAQTVHACSLESDFEQFSARDFTEVGERGITLSGGQKARIALARCVYQQSDIILLDDVLSAVDGHVANHIFTNCIQGLVRDSTRIMTTHNWKILELADRIVYMPGDGSCKIGTLEELRSSNDMFALAYNANVRASSHDSESNFSKDFNEDSIEENADNEKEPDIAKQLSRAPVEGKHVLVQEESRHRGVVTGNVLYAYFNAGAVIGLAFIPVIVILALTVAAGSSMQTVFLQFWTSNRYHTSSGFYIGMYCLIISLRALAFVAMAVGVCTFCFNSSSFLHNRAVENIYRAPMSYFDSTPLGRIINRFTDDTANLDTQLYMELRMALFSGSMLIASLAIIFAYVPYVAIALVPIVIVAFLLLNFYRASAREIKRINGVFRSRMFSVVNETISGLSVILSFRKTDAFGKLLDKHIDSMVSSFTIVLASQFYLALRCVWVAMIAVLITVLLAATEVFNLNASKVGMLLSLLPSVTISIVMLLPMLAELENQFNSVERLYDLGFLIPQEAAYEVPEKKPSESWPDVGKVEFENTHLKYRPEQPDVLKGINLTVQGGEKIGICGRTGAGKSTILSALFRITELSGGRIVIDGVDISEIGLGDLRQKLSIIPQDPVLFQGTIRTNLDPFNNHTDLELWDALRRSGVIRANEFMESGQVSRSHKFHLDTVIDSDGSNFSLGERQLLTLARALVRQSRIIVLDEATAAVDQQTDAQIQRTIATEFKGCTILCIAHRLQTILHYDRILVMDSGKIVELDTPMTLFQRPGSIFSSMCVDAGITENDFQDSKY